jgi:hypothetical protein
MTIPKPTIEAMSALCNAYGKVTTAAEVVAELHYKLGELPGGVANLELLLSCLDRRHIPALLEATDEVLASYGGFANIEGFGSGGVYVAADSSGHWLGPMVPRQFVHELKQALVNVPKGTTFDSR